MMKILKLSFLSAFLAVICGCGYTTTSLLQADFNSIHVSNFVNKIDPSAQISDKRASYNYWPGLETDITRAVIDGFIYDRHLDVDSEKKAALLLKGELVDFRQFPLSYNEGESVEEVRIEVIVDIELYDNRTGKLIWRQNGFMGQADYDVVGPNKKNEGDAVAGAVKDLGERIVELIVEAW